MRFVVDLFQKAEGPLGVPFEADAEEEEDSQWARTVPCTIPGQILSYRKIFQSRFAKVNSNRIPSTHVPY